MTYEEQLEATILQLEHKLDDIAGRYIKAKEVISAIRTIRIESISYRRDDSNPGLHGIVIEGTCGDAFDVAKFKEAFENTDDY